MSATRDVDEYQIRSMVDFLRSQPEITGYLVNGHAGEGLYLSLDEQVANLRIYREAMPQTTITCGTFEEDPAKALGNIASLARHGADAILVFPPWSLSGPVNWAALGAYYEAVCKGSPLPVVLYYPAIFSSQAVPIAKMVEWAALPNVVALKDGSWEVVQFEWLRRAIREAGLQVEVLGSSDEHFFYNFIAGTAGCQASMVACAPEAIGRLAALVRTGKIDAAYEIHCKLAPLVRYIYRSDVAQDMVARLKLAMHLRGAIDMPHFRAPRDGIRDDEVATMRALMADLPGERRR